MGLLPLSRPAIQGAEAEVAVRLERAHAQLLGRLGLRGLALRHNVAKEAQGIRLVATFLELAGERQCMLGEGVRRLQAVSLRLRFPQGKTTERLKADYFRGNGPFHRLREQRYGIGDAPSQDVRRTQGCRYPGEKGQDVHILTDAHGPFEQEERPGQVAVAEAQ